MEERTASEDAVLFELMRFRVYWDFPNATSSSVGMTFDDCLRMKLFRSESVEISLLRLTASVEMTRGEWIDWGPRKIRVDRIMNYEL